MDAIATSIGGFLGGFSGIRTTEIHSIEKSDLNTKYKNGLSGIENIVSSYTEVKDRYFINNFEFIWNRYRNGIKGRTLINKKESGELFDLIKNIENNGFNADFFFF